MTVSQRQGTLDDTIGRMQREIQSLQRALFSSPPLVEELPENPADGQEVSLLVSAANGIVWRMRYREASASTFKWEFVGGPPSSAGPVGAVSEKITEAEQALTSGPELIVPVEGVYEIGLGLRLESLEAASRTLSGILRSNGFAIGGTGRLEVVGSTVFMGSNFGPIYNKVQLAAGAKLTVGISQTGVQKATYSGGWLSMLPVRI